MAEYIEREKLLAKIDEAFFETDPDGKEQIGVLKCRAIIRESPAADVALVVHGEWETEDWLEYDAQSCETIRCPEEGIACTRCRYVFKKDALWKRNSCPNCGARMDGDSEAG